jgi:hypothetical protein
VEEGAPRRSVKTPLIAAQVCAALNEAGARYLVMGGIACIPHGYVRATTDVDILIERTEANLRRGLDDLIATKRTSRSQDAADIEVLEEIRRLREIA